MTAAGRAAEDVREQARTQEAASKVVASSQSFIEGEDASGKPDPLRTAVEDIFDRIEKTSEKMFGGSFDLDPAGFDDLEELGGAQALASGVQESFNMAETMGKGATVFGPAFLQTERMQRVGEILADKVELLPGEREGEVFASPTDDVSTAYLGMIDDIATKTGLRVGKVFDLMGQGDLGITSIDTRGLRASLEAGGVQ